ncbi:MAG: hypothetical protein WCL50_09560, partial [Spirochaetota bacterium]
MTKRSKILVTSGVIAALAIVVLGGFLLAGSLASKETSNALSLARDYIDRGDFDRALDILDRLLISDAGNKDARGLRDRAVEGKKSQSAAAKAEQASGEAALAKSLEKVGSALSSKPAVASGAAADEAAKKKAEEAQIAAQKKAEEAQAAAQRKAEAEAQKKAEAEAEAARKKAADDELARQGAELQRKMREVNDLVDKGRGAATKGDFPQAMTDFTAAEERFPEGQDKFAGQKLADIAESLYSAARKNPGPEADKAVKDAGLDAEVEVRGV